MSKVRVACAVLLLVVGGTALLAGCGGSSSSQSATQTPSKAAATGTSAPTQTKSTSASGGRAKTSSAVGRSTGLTGRFNATVYTLLGHEVFTWLSFTSAASKLAPCYFSSAEPDISTGSSACVASILNRYRRAAADANQVSGFADALTQALSPGLCLNDISALQDMASDVSNDSQAVVSDLSADPIDDTQLVADQRVTYADMNNGIDNGALTHWKSTCSP